VKRGSFKFVVLLVAMAAILAAAAYVRSRGFSARREPNALEAVLARNLRRFALPRGARDAANPVAATPEVLSEAMEHFADHCAFCHANDGSGSTPIGKGFYPKPPDMRLAPTQSLTDGELFYIIHNGVRFTGMPAFGSADSADDLDSWKLVRFIRHLPALTDQELARMKDMNPKTPADLKEEEEIQKFLEGGDAPASKGTHEHHH
jgi:mono/diheme cytochrome c family protein